MIWQADESKQQFDVRVHTQDGTYATLKASYKDISFSSFYLFISYMIVTDVTENRYIRFKPTYEL